MEETESRDFIPEEYKFAHEYCFFLVVISKMVDWGSNPTWE